LVGTDKIIQAQTFAYRLSSDMHPTLPFSIIASNDYSVANPMGATYIDPQTGYSNFSC
jgi:hypothetical protein